MPSSFSEEDTYSDTFAADVVSDISSELFTKPEPASLDDSLGKGETVNEEVVEKPAALEAKPALETPQGQVLPGQNSVGKPLPKSWKKDVAPLWEKADPALHEYIYSREADMMRGIQQYAQGHQQWDALIKPFAPIFQQHPDVQPVQILQGLMNTHLQLLNPSLPGEKKLEMAKAIMAEYGIDFGEAQAHARPEYVTQLENRLAQMENLQRRREQEAFAAGVADQEKAVISFAQDPKNKYFPEVQNDILRFIQTGAAQDLPTAYELACYANPAVRAKMLAEQQALPPAGQQPKRDASGKFINLESNPDTKPPRTRKVSMDETIDAVVATHYSKH